MEKTFLTIKLGCHIPLKGLFSAVLKFKIENAFWTISNLKIVHEDAESSNFQTL